MPYQCENSYSLLLSVGWQEQREMLFLGLRPRIDNRLMSHENIILTYGCESGYDYFTTMETGAAVPDVSWLRWVRRW